MTESFTPHPFLSSLEFAPKKTNLEETFAIADLLGNPQSRIHCIHIAGTNGKGSTAKMLSTIYQEAGFTVGLFTSPHIQHVTERFQINNEPISSELFEKAVQTIKDILRETHFQITYIEILTFVAFLVFAWEKVDLAIIETGVGGRLDPTNICTPILSVITSISYDHKDLLGETIEEIASEKAGIIKNSCPVVVAQQHFPEALIVLQETVKQRNSTLYYTPQFLTVRQTSEHLSSQEISVSGFYEGSYTLSLKGTYQLENVATVLSVCQQLQKQFSITQDHIRNALAKVHWPGRMTVLHDSPLVLADGAHNKSGYTYLGKFFSAHPANNKILVLGQAHSKESSDLPESLLLSAHLIICVDGAFKSKPASQLAKEIHPIISDKEMIIAQSQEEALRLAWSRAEKEDMILLAGSLYLVADLMGVWNTLALPTNDTNLAR